MGLSSNSIDELQVKEFARFIQQMFGYLELSDIPLACDMACAGKLNGIDISKHHRLSNTLIGQMLNSYGAYKRLHVKNDQTPTEEIKVSEKTKEKIITDEIEYQFNELKEGRLNKKDYTHLARLFRWLQNNSEKDLTGNVETIRERNRKKILQTTKIETPKDKRLLNEWDSGKNDTYDVKLTNLIQSDLFIQYLEKCLEEGKNWDWCL